RRGSFNAPAVYGQTPGLRAARRAARKVEPSDRADGGKRLAAKTHRGDMRQVDIALCIRCEFRGRMALYRDEQAFAVHAAAIVKYDELLLAAAAYLNVDAGRAGVETVL